jgi:hypothetical protein
MADMQHKVTEFRRYAALCVEIAGRMSRRENRDRIMELAQRFLQMAEKEEGKAE